MLIFSASAKVDRQTKMENMCQYSGLQKVQECNITIDALNDYCLLEIFKHLTVKDKFMAATGTKSCFS